MASYDATLGFEGLVDLAVRVEKRLRKSIKGETNTEDEDDTDESDSYTNTDVEWDEEEKSKAKNNKKKKQKAKKEKKAKKDSASSSEKGNSKFIDLNSLMDKIKELGMNVAKEEKPYCQICEKTGHLTPNCWYNPNYRGNILPGLQQRNLGVNAVRAEPQDKNNQGWYSQDQRNYNYQVPPNRNF